jgi:rhamnosyltransferase
MKICMGVVLYYPNQSDIKRILSYTNTVDKLIVFDNTDDGNNENSAFFTSTKNIQYISQGKNLGMARALNELCKKAISNGYDYIITMDQDSIFKHCDILNLVNYISSKRLDNIGIIAPRVYYLNKKSKPDKGNTTKKELEQKNEFVDWVITSGSAINLDAFTTTKGFDEKYFIDRVDYDYCMQLKTLSKKIVLVNNSFLYQQLGEGTQNYFGYLYSEHSALRNYYTFRNRLYYADKFMIGFRKEIYKFIGSIRHLLLIILFDKNKKQKLKMIKRAYIDYAHGKMNKYMKN